MQFKSQIVRSLVLSAKGEFNGRPSIQPRSYTKPICKMVKILAGQAGDEIKWGTNLFNFEKIKNQKYPFWQTLFMEQVSNGKITVTIIKELTLVSAK